MIESGFALLDTSGVSTVAAAVFGPAKRFFGLSPHQKAEEVGYFPSSDTCAEHFSVRLGDAGAGKGFQVKASLALDQGLQVAREVHQFIPVNEFQLKSIRASLYTHSTFFKILAALGFCVTPRNIDIFSRLCDQQQLPPGITSSSQVGN